MESQSLVKYAEYNELLGEVYSKLKFSSYRNHLDLLWLNGAKILNDSIENLLSVDVWTKNESKLLEKLKSIISSKLKKGIIVQIGVGQVEEILELSIDSLIDRDELVQESIYEKEYKSFKNLLYLLDANVRLLRLIRNKIKNSELNHEDLDSMNIVSLSLTKSYLFLSGDLKDKSYLADSLKKVKETWRTYYPLEKIKVV